MMTHHFEAARQDHAVSAAALHDGTHQRLDRLRDRLLAQPDPSEVDSLIEERDRLLKTVEQFSLTIHPALDELALISDDRLTPAARRRFEEETAWLALGLRDAHEPAAIAKLLKRSRIIRLALLLDRYPARQPRRGETVQ